MTITINLQSFHQILTWIQLHPWIIVIAWYFIAFFVVRYFGAISKDRWKRMYEDDKFECAAGRTLVWLFSPLALIVFPFIILSRLLTPVK